MNLQTGTDGGLVTWHTEPEHVPTRAHIMGKPTNKRTICGKPVPHSSNGGYQVLNDAPLTDICRTCLKQIMNSYL